MQFRSLFRYRQQVAKDLRKSMIRITSFLYTRGKYFNERNWTVEFIKWMKSDLGLQVIEQLTLNALIEDYTYQKKRSRLIVKEAQQLVLAEPRFSGIYSRLRRIPGIGPICAIAFICEISDMKRFKNENQFASYIGLVPSVRSSDQTEHVLGLQHHSNRVLRTLVVQAAWMSIRKDPALLDYYNQASQRTCAHESGYATTKSNHQSS